MRKTGSLMDSRSAHLLFQLMGRVMDSPLRYRLSNPVAILEGAGIQPGQEVLEIGCGTGFFTVPAAELVGSEGRVYALDPHPLAIEEVTRKIQDAAVANVSLIRGDAT
jgi:demethylmenaquinone methyltransferase/2-methoxy-6-polyprenyl-1,4-benzoquinol methylase